MDAVGVRIGWADLPAHVRAEVERIVGGPVVAVLAWLRERLARGAG